LNPAPSQDVELLFGLMQEQLGCPEKKKQQQHPLI